MLSCHPKPALLATVTFLLLANFAQSEETKLTASDASSQSQFAWEVALAGNQLFVGNHLKNSGVGCVYYFDFDGEQWLEQDIIVSSDKANANFGSSVALHNNAALVGAERDDPNGADSGSVYIMEYFDDAWHHSEKIAPANGNAYAHFGNSVAISEETFLIGAYLDDTMGFQSGAAYFYQRATGLFQRILVADGGSSGQFGSDVAITDSGIAIIGCSHDDPLGTNSGSAYIYEFIEGSWERMEKLIPVDGAGSDEFGCSVAIVGNTAFVGAPNNDEIGTNMGAVYVFEKIGSLWVENQKLTSIDGDLFGFAVSVSGDFLIVGSPGSAGAVSNTGSAFVYEKEGATWIFKERLYASDGVWGDNFGVSVAVSNSLVAVGAPYVDDGIIYSIGSAYVFDLMASSAIPESSKPETRQLIQNYPNPFNPSTTIKYEIPVQETLSLRIYNISGHLVRTLISGEITQAGSHQAMWNGLDDGHQPVATGIYFCQMKAGSFSKTIRMALVK